MTHLICIGAQRAATTWLFSVLSNTFDEISELTIKEAHYFNQIWLPSQRSWCINHRLRQAYEAISWTTKSHDYELLVADNKLFRRINRLAGVFSSEATDSWYREFIMAGNDIPNRLTLDFTPEYALLPIEGIKHMDSLCPDSHYVFILRNPIPRAYSHLLKLNTDEGLGLDPDTIAQYIERNPDIVERSDYKNTIDLFSQCIHRDRFHCIIQDDLVGDPINVLASLATSIGLEPRAIDGESAHMKKHISINKWRYTANEVMQLKTELWSVFSRCYNNLDELEYVPTEKWRNNAESFLDGLLND